MTPSRNRERNVCFAFASTPGVLRGGLYAAQSYTSRKFLNVLNMVFIASGGFKVCLEGSSVAINPTDQPLQHGKYILTPLIQGQQIRRTNQRLSIPVLSMPSATRDVVFQQQVRDRDRRCLITGRYNLDADAGFWNMFEMAHIFPLGIQHIFTAYGSGQIAGISSPQNRILLRCDIHSLWDTVDPNNGYIVQSFRPDPWEFHGNILYPASHQPDNPYSVIDALLRWHFQQAVLANMRGAQGEPAFVEIRAEPHAAERMEAV